MNQSTVVLDSFALMAYFNNEREAKEVRKLMDKAKSKGCVLKLSAINWGEIYYNIARDKGMEAAQQCLIFMEQLPIEIVDIDRRLILDAALLKSRYALSYADCFAAALAQREDCPVLTGDKEFKQLPPAIKVRFLP